MKRFAHGMRLYGLAAITAATLLAGCSVKSSLAPAPVSRPMVALTSPGGGPVISPAAAISEELWVISRSPASQQANEDTPGSGALIAKPAGRERDEKTIPMPLKHTDVRASVSGYIGSVEVVQQFENPYDTKIEAVYVFPLPHNAAINEFIMTIGERRIRGVIREREEAEAIYESAKRQGYVASLLTEERPNVFSQSVANIEPGKAIDVTIRYFNTLEYVDGWYEFVFPMVVGPRFNPPGTKSGIGAVATGQSGSSGQPTEVPYLGPNQRSGHDISLRLEVDAGVQIEEFVSHSHAVTRETAAPEKLVVSLNPGDAIPNKDFVLRYRVAGSTIKTSLLTHQAAGGGYFTLMLFPPQELARLERQPLELVFVLDCSGSMSGMPLKQAKAAVERGLRLLQPGDSFQLINFSTKAGQLGPAPLEATPQNIQRGLKYLNSLNSEGGTMMIEGIRAALAFPHDPERLRFVSFLTDGYIGNETEILGEIRRALGPSRIFSFGVGSSVNRYLLDSMAKMGRGAVAYLGPNDDGGQVMGAFFNRIAHPALTDIQVDWGAMQVSDVFPREVPDLFAGRAVILTGRNSGPSSGRIRITGRAAGRTIKLETSAASSGNASRAAIPSVWANMKIADLGNESIYSSDTRISEQIRQVALDYNLMSAFTAFVAVDASRRTEGSQGVTVPVAVPVPEGVRYDTVVDERPRQR
jgi:Ca-activated chloride channel family protein